MLDDVDRFGADSRKVRMTVRECLGLINQGAATSERSK
tara:strand:- start:891 stop:1004 length:114 start_codon:yes stop_codon:yes gene_type:complete